MGVARLGLGLLDVGEYLLGAHQVALPGFGQGDAPGGAMQQAGLQVGLQLGHRTGDIGGRQVRRWAAAVKLPVSATLTNARILNRISITAL